MTNPRSLPADAMIDPPFDDDDLDEQLAQLDDEPDDPPPVARWVPPDDRAAEWAMRKLADAQDEIERHDMLLAGYIDEIRKWHATATARARRTAARMEGALAEYALAERAENNRRTIHLPSGDITTRPAGGRPEVVDPVVVASFLAEHLPEDTVAEIVRPEVSKKALGKVIDVVPVDPDDEEAALEARLSDTGHVVPGVIVTPRRISPTIRPWKF